MQDLATYMFPAFVAGAIFMLIVGGGILGLMRFRFPTANTERAGAGRDLVRAGIVVIVVAAAGCVPARWEVSSLGPWIFLVPAAMAADGVAFLCAGALFLRR